MSLDSVVSGWKPEEEIMRGKISPILLLLILSAILGMAQQGEAKPIPYAYIVQVAETADANQIAKAVTASTHGVVRHIYAHTINGFAIHVPVGITKADIILQPGVIKVEPDLEVKHCGQAIPTGVNRIDIELNGTAKIDGLDERVDVNVAIIDTGIDGDHPDLNVYAAGSRNFTSSQASQWDDDDGHGTHVAGIVGALDNDIGVVGVAPGVRLWAIKVLKEHGPSWLSDALEGVDYVTANAGRIEVANMSLGAEGRSDIFRQAIQNSVAAGVVYVVAAGNESRDVYGTDGIFDTTDDAIPAAYPEAAAISAMADSDGKPGGMGGSTGYGSDDSFAGFSNFSRSVVANNLVNSPGAAIDLLMPGVKIYSTYKNGGYATLSGTSMASPHAAGLVALYIAENGRATGAGDVYAIRQALINGGVAQIDSRGLAVLNDPDGYQENIGYYIRGDFNHDGIVDFEDLAILTFYWLGNDALADIVPLGGDGIVNFVDFSGLAENWMR
jgi:hypothetical protein